ncbi:MAG: hypothetical protein HZA16_06950 [Nitrospirae bacterium]|nr:hypothetical protein [Nitrospirota bacterium]
MKSQINILVVDNDPKIIKSAWHALNPEGFNVEGALTGKDSMSRLRQHDYALVFIDADVPDGIVYAPAHFSHSGISAVTHLPGNGGVHMDAVRVETS